MTKFTHRMLIDATPTNERLLRDGLARRLSTAIDKAAVDGDGRGEPTGLFATWFPAAGDTNH